MVVGLAAAGVAELPVRASSAARQDARPATRIVSVVPSATEILFALGAGAQIAAVSSYDELPAGAPVLPRVGALLNPDTERILALRPDLVIVYDSQAELEVRLARAGIRTYSYRHAGVADVLDTIHELADATGRAAEGARLIAEIQSRLEAIARRVRGRPRPRTLLVIDREPGSLRGVYASGGRGFLHEMLAIAGGVNVFADVDRESVQPSTETLLARAPEVIVEVRAVGLIGQQDAEQARGIWQALSAIPAVRTGRLVVLTGQHVVIPGSRIADGTEAMARALHPDAFP